MKLRGLGDRDVRMPDGTLFLVKTDQEIVVDDSNKDLVKHWRQVAAGGAVEVIEDKDYSPSLPDDDAPESVWREYGMRHHGLSVDEANNMSKEELQDRYKKG